MHLVGVGFPAGSGEGRLCADAERACRTVAVTPFKARSMDFAEVKRVCDDCTMAGFKAIYESVPAKPFRFFYFSGDGVPEDPKKKPLILGDYLVMRVSDNPSSTDRPDRANRYRQRLTCAHHVPLHPCRARSNRRS